MTKEYITEDGHIFSQEDIVFYVRVLTNIGILKDEILCFDDSEMWQECAKTILNRYDSNETKH